MNPQHPRLALKLAILFFSGLVVESGGYAMAQNQGPPWYSPASNVLQPHARELTPDELYHKVWSLIKDEFYDLSFNRQTWSRWEHRYDGKLQTLDDSHKAIATMLASLGDRYTRFLDKDAFGDERSLGEAHLCGIGIQMGMDRSSKIIVIAPIKDAPAARAGVMAGDEIAGINGNATKGMTVEGAAKYIKGPKGIEVALTLIRQGTPLKLTIKRDEIHMSAVQTAEMITSNLGYIKLVNLISPDANKEMIKALNDLASARGIILDLRDNPGGFTSPGSTLINAIEISNMFLDGGREIVSTVDRAGYRTPAKSDGHPISQQALVVLINRGTAHAAEIVAAALHDNGRATLVGERSFGLGLIQGLTRLDDNSAVNVTIARWLAPNTDVNRRGITPDVVVPLNEKDYKEGHGPWWLDPNGPVAAAEHKPEDMKDDQLKKAVEVLESKIGNP